MLRTSRLLDILNEDDETPWPEYTANGLTPRGLQLLLKDYGISSANRRFHGGVQAKGFARLQFLDSWARYCPEPTHRPAHRHGRLTRHDSSHSSPRRSARGRVAGPATSRPDITTHPYLP